MRTLLALIMSTIMLSPAFAEGRLIDVPPGTKIDTHLREPGDKTILFLRDKDMRIAGMFVNTVNEKGCKVEIRADGRGIVTRMEEYRCP